MPTRKLLACLAAAAALAGCVALPWPRGVEPVTPAYAAGGGRYDDGATVIILTRTFEQAGNTAVCGTRTAHSMTGRTLFLNRQVAGAAALEIAGDRIATGLDRLPEAPFRPDMTGATAACFLTDRPWRQAYAEAAPQIRIPRLQFPEGDGDGFGGGWGEAVTFRQAPVHRPLP